MKHNCERCNTDVNWEGLCYQCKCEIKRDEFIALPDEEIEKLILTTVDQINNSTEGKWNDNDNTVSMLISYRGIYSKRIAKATLAKRVYFPIQLYYQASAEVRDGLIEHLLETENPNEANWIMQCVAMQGDDVALEALYNLEQNPRPWRKKLYVDPSVYAESGGWTFDKNKKRTELNFDTCLHLAKGEKSANEPIIVGASREDNCTSCGCQMVDLLIIDGNDEHLNFLKIDGKIKATCCPNCVDYNTVYNKYTIDGESEVWFDEENFCGEENYVTETELIKMSNNQFVLSTKPMPPLSALADEEVHSIGGFANWIQDAVFKECPCCKNKMKFLGQLKFAALLDGESTCYIEICTDCKTLAMFCQNS